MNKHTQRVYAKPPLPTKENFVSKSLPSGNSLSFVKEHFGKFVLYCIFMYMQSYSYILNTYTSELQVEPVVVGF